MAYSTQSDLEQAVGGAQRLVELTDWDNTTALDLAKMNAAIAEADALIDSYLVKQFAVPVPDPVPLVLAKVSARLAIYFLKLPRGMANETTVQLSYDRDVKWLEGVADGSISLGVQPQPSPSSMRFDRSSERPTSKDVSRAKLRGFS